MSIVIEDIIGGVHTCAAHSVYILLVVVGRVIVDNEDKLLHIQAAGSHARGDEQAADVRLEVVDGRLPVALVLATVQRQAGVPHLQSSASPESPSLEELGLPPIASYQVPSLHDSWCQVVQGKPVAASDSFHIATLRILSHKACRSAQQLISSETCWSQCQHVMIVFLHATISKGADLHKERRLGIKTGAGA